jgi:SPP1 family holin
MDKASLARVVALVFSLLAYFGLNIPNEWQEWTVGTVLLVMSIYSAYRNNYLFKKGKKQKEVLDKHGLK